VISDVHSNRQALEAVLAAIEAAGTDELWCLGDLVGYGADPDFCTETVLERADACLVGNHDLAVLEQIDVGTFSATAAAAVAWTKEAASAETLARLGELSPRASRAEFGLFHASPRDPIWEYVLSIEQAEAGLDALAERIGLIGHSHVALFFTRPTASRPTYAHGSQAPDGALLDLDSGAWLLNPGSVGQPRDADPRAAWLEIDTDEWTARYHRVPYDIAGAAEAIRATALPGSLAERLGAGR
jgi:diadenosine tetraphosphatase ApaH/serine/threonine PP2A family protein phosphatase